MKKIISTLPDSVSYERRSSAACRVIRGGAYPLGVTPSETLVPDEDATFLSAHGIFNLHVAGGFMKIVDDVAASKKKT